MTNAFQLLTASYVRGNPRMAGKTAAHNRYEKACREFLKGCSCADDDKQEMCEECLKAFCDHLRSLQEEEATE